MASETFGTGALRLTAPTATAYDQSPGEQLVLKGLNPENLGGMYGLLLNQRASGMQQQDRYRSDLQGVNAQQYQLGQAKLQADELASLRNAGIDLGKLGVDISNIAPLQSLLRSPTLTQQTDQLRRDSMAAKSFSDMGSGLNTASQAGVNLVPGQAVTMDPNALRRLAAVTGDPRSITEQRIQSAATLGAARTRAAADDDVTLKATVGNVPGEDRDEYSGKNQEEVLRRAAAARQARGRGGLTGPAAGTGGTGGTGGSASGVRTADQARTRIRELGLPAGTRISEVGGTFSALLPDGTRQPLR